MPTITAIKPQKNKRRVNIFLDDKFGFGLDLENFLKLRLKVEQELSDKEVEDLVKKSEFQKTLDKLLRFATLRPRSEKEVENWFKKRKVHESLRKELFNRLKRLELLDDEKFGRWWIDQRVAFRPKGKRALEEELKGKGLNISLISKIISEAKIDEKPLAKSILERKIKVWGSLKRNEVKKRAGEFLLRKGFDWEIVKSVVDEMLPKR